MELEESKTYKNLETALQGEALAYLKYQFYKSKIADISKDLENKIDEIVHNEKEHGKIWFKLLHDGEVPDNITNLIDALHGEVHEHEKMYPEFAQIAYDEGFDDIGYLFNSVAKIEGQHAREFLKIGNNIDDDVIFNDSKPIQWKCLNCGYVTSVGFNALEECPVCKHPKKYFVRL